MRIYQASSATAAVELAVRFRKAGRYDWFRGQTHTWPPIPTLLRLDAAGRRLAKQRLKRYCHWLLHTRGLEPLRRNLDGAIATAQHYGLPTTFLDFTRNPAIAGFFAAANSKKFEPGTACIFCLSTRDLADVWGAVRKILPHYPDIEPVTVRVPNLWRLEAQEGAFLLCPRNWERHYPLDRIEFPLGPRPPYPTVDQVYPRRKSQLEQLLDHHFSVEEFPDMRRVLRKVFPRIKILNLRPPKCGYHQEYFGDAGLSRRRDWSANRLAKWITVPREDYRTTATGEISLRLDRHLSPTQVREAVAYSLRRILEGNPALRRQAVRWRIEPLGLPPKSLREALDRLWNGLRRLPFLSDDIADGIALCFALHAAKFCEATDTEKRVVIARECVGPCICVSLSAWNGSHARAIVSEQQLDAALRPDLVRRLRPEHRDYASNAHALLQLCWEPRRLFAFDPLSRLFATQLAPTQVLMPTAAAHFSPARVTAFGLP